MIVKTDAIAANIRPFSETSHVVTWLTPDYGKIATIIKGAQRPKNRFLGQYDLFYTCELLFYLRLFQGLHIVRECFPLNSRPLFRTCWPATACASYFTGLAAKITPMYAPHRNIYLLLDKALDFFAAEENPPSSKDRGGQALEAGLYWFELKLLGIMGFSPVLNACLQCRRPLAPEKNTAGKTLKNEIISITFSAAHGGVLCGACSGNYKEGAMRVAPDTLALLRFWQSLKNIHAVRNVLCTERQLKEVSAILENFLQHHLETENTGRAVALALLRKQRQISP